MDLIISKFDELMSFFSGGLTGDLFLIFALAGIGVAYGIFLGRRYVLNVLIGIYISYAILNVIPTNWLKHSSPFNALIFLLLVVFCVRFGPALFNMHNIWQSHKVIWKVIIMCILEVGLIFSIISPFFTKEIMQYIPLSNDDYFSTSMAQFVWMVLPLGVLFILNKNRSID